MFRGSWYNGSQPSVNAYNEGVKLTATLFNNLATLCLGSAFVAPMFDINAPIASSPWLWIVLCGGIGVGFWFCGQVILAWRWEG